MNLREVLRSLDSDLKKDLIKRINECPDANYFSQDKRDKRFYGYKTNNIEFFDRCWRTDYYNLWFIYEITLADDHATTILTRNEVLELLKEEEYTLDNLPENWFVEMSDNVDIDLVFKILNLDETIKANEWKYYGEGKNSNFDDRIDYFDSCTNVTNLFLKKKEKNKMQEIIEIHGKKYRKVNTDGKFKNGNLVFRENTGLIGKFIGYNEDDGVIYANTYTNIRPDYFVKLEEIKVYYYAIYKINGVTKTSSMYNSEEELRDVINGEILEIRTYEEI